MPKGVEVKIAKEVVSIKGPKGQLETKLPVGLHLKQEGQELLLECDAEKVEQKALYGLYRSLLKNNVQGVSEGYEVKLTLIGVGYRANVQGQKLDLQLRLLSPNMVEIPKTLQVTVDKGTSIPHQGCR